MCKAHHSESNLIRPSVFLCALKHTPEFTQHGLKISTKNWDLFKKVRDNGKQVLLALKSFRNQAGDIEETTNLSVTKLAPFL